MKENLLKKISYGSIICLFSVSLISFSLPAYKEVEAFRPTPEEIIEEMGLELVETVEDNWEEEEIEQATLGERISIEREQENVLEQLDKRYIVLPKTDNMELSVMYYYNEKKIDIKIFNSNNNFSNSIIRVAGKKHYKGNPDESKKTKDILKKQSIVNRYSIEKEQWYTSLSLYLDHVYVPTIYHDSLNYYITLKRPKEVYNKILVVDAGHGGTAVGTASIDKMYWEKDLNLRFVQALKNLLDKGEIKVYYTRLEDTTVYLNPRVNLANDIDADFFLSIHCNASDATSAYGTEILYDELAYLKGLPSEQLATILINEFTEKTGRRNRGLVYANSIHIMGNSKVPAALLEIGYMTNEEDLAYMLDNENELIIVEAIYNGILKVYEQLQ